MNAAVRTHGTNFFHCAVVACAAIAISTRFAQAQTCEPQWLPGEGYPGLNSTAYAAKNWDPDGSGPMSPLLVVGGDFNVAGNVLAQRVAAWNGTTWELLGEAPLGCRALVVFNDTLVAGCSTGVWQWDGTTWQPLGGPMNSAVYALVVHQGALIAGGAFNTAEGEIVNRIAQWDGTHWQPLGSGMSSWVYALASYDGKIVAGGEFISAGGSIVNRIAQWDGTSWQPMGGGMNAAVHALAHYDGNLVAGGFFTTAGGVGANRIAKWDGAGWQPLGSGLGSGFESQTRVLSLTAWNGMLTAGGRWGGATGMVSMWNGAVWQLTLGGGLYGAYGESGSINALSVYEGDLIAVGSMGSAGGHWNSSSDAFGVRHVARYNGTTWSALGGGMDNAVWALTTFNNQMIAGGVFTTAGGSGARCIAQWDGAIWQPLGDGIGGNFQYPHVRALQSFRGNLVAGGYFLTAGGQPAAGIAQWDGSVWSALGQGAYPTHALAEYQGKLIASGDGFVKSWDGAQWEQLGDIVGCTYPECNSIVYALAVFDDGTGEALYAAGELVIMEGMGAGFVARWNGSNWQILASANALIFALHVYDGDLFAAGSFTTVGGEEINAIARWNGSTWSPLGEGLSTYVRSLTEYNGDLIAGGYSVDRWSRTTGWQQLSQPGDVMALATFRGELIGGGYFGLLSGGSTAPFFARWTDTNIPWIAASGQPQDANATCAGDALFTVTPASGYENLSYEWRKNGIELLDGPTPHGSVISGTTTSSLTISSISGADAGIYDVIVSNSCGETASEASQLEFTQCGDVTGDGAVNVNDLLAVINAWGPCPAPPQLCPADIAPPPNGDGVVNVNDLLMVINNWG